MILYRGAKPSTKINLKMFPINDLTFGGKNNEECRVLCKHFCHPYTLHL